MPFELGIAGGDAISDIVGPRCSPSLSPARTMAFRALAMHISTRLKPGIGDGVVVQRLCARALGKLMTERSLAYDSHGVDAGGL